MDTEKYLQDLYMLEASCYEQKQIINRLRNRLNTLKTTPDRKHIVGRYKDETGLGPYIFVFPVMIAIIFELFGKEILGYIVGGIVLLVECLVQWLFIYPDKKHNKKERARVAAENQRIDEYNRQFRTQLPARCSALSAQISTAEKSLSETHTTLNKLYSLDVIFPKYRNITAVTSFYEYFCAGRCTALTGHEGAYNIYEQEVRMGVIIDKLDIIIERLEEIEHNQYMIAEAIKKGNEKAEQIYAKMCECADKLQSIDQNTMITGYFSAITAANTACLAKYHKN